MPTDHQVKRVKGHITHPDLMLRPHRRRTHVSAGEEKETCSIRGRGGETLTALAKPLMEQVIEGFHRPLRKDLQTGRDQAPRALPGALRRC